MLIMKVTSLVIIIFLIALMFSLTKSQICENMAYLDQYETQDNYRNVPSSWPIPYTSTTAMFAARRRALGHE